MIQGAVSVGVGTNPPYDRGDLAQLLPRMQGEAARGRMMRVGHPRRLDSRPRGLYRGPLEAGMRHASGEGGGGR
jgi:hypothetical protein